MKEKNLWELFSEVEMKISPILAGNFYLPTPCSRICGTCRGEARASIGGGGGECSFITCTLFPEPEYMNMHTPQNNALAAPLTM